MSEITESRIREIAKEESLKVHTEMMKEITEIKNATKENKKTLERLYRLLLGELGVDKADTLKARAEFAYQYAKMNTDLRVVERALPALDWFERWDTPEHGCEESRLQSLGKLVGLYTKVKWLLGLIGITTLINAIPVIQSIIGWVSSMAHP